MSTAPSPLYDLEVTICSATDLKNINWRHGPLKPYAVLWTDPAFKCSTRADEDGDTCPVWHETLLVPLRAPVRDSTLHIDVVHAYAAEDVKPLIGSASVPLREIVDEFGFGSVAGRTLRLTRPSGRPQGTLEVRIVIRDRRRERAAPPPPIPPPAPGGGYYGVAPPPTPVGYGWYPPPPPPPPPAYYEAAAAPGYPAAVYGEGEEKRKGKMGMGTGLALGAAAGVLGGIVLTEGVEHLEKKIEEDVAEKVEEDVAYDDDGVGFGGDDFY